MFFVDIIKIQTVNNNLKNNLLKTVYSLFKKINVIFKKLSIMCIFSTMIFVYTIYEN